MSLFSTNTAISETRHTATSAAIVCRHRLVVRGGEFVITSMQLQLTSVDRCDGRFLQSGRRPSSTRDLATRSHVLTGLQTPNTTSQRVRGLLVSGPREGPTTAWSSRAADSSSVVCRRKVVESTRGRRRRRRAATVRH